jgi:ligand-binding sensor domain-containing protein
MVSAMFFRIYPVIGQGNIEFKNLPFPELSQNIIYDMVQDSRGYLWIATFSGVYKYDGYHVERLMAANAQNKKLPIGSSNVLCLTRDDHLWIIYHNEALVDLNIKKSTFEIYRHQPGDENSISTNMINSIVEDKNENLWIATYKGLECFDKKTKKFTHFRKNHGGLETDSISALCFDSDNNLYLGSDHKGEGLYFLDHKTMNFSRVYQVPMNNDFFTVDRLVIDKQNNIWISNNSRTFMIDHERKIHTIIGADFFKSESQTVGSGALMITANSAWIGTNTGLYLYNKKTKNIIHIEHNGANPTSLNNNRISCLFRDKSENTWIGTEEGLSKVSKVQFQIHTIKHQIFEDSYLRKKQVRSLYVDPGQGTIWTGTSGEGLLKWNGDGTWSQYLFLQHFTQYGFNYVNDICPLHNGNLALATWHGIEVFDTKSNKFIFNKYCVSNIHQKFFDVPLWSIWEDGNNRLWLGSKTQGLFLYDLAANIIRHVDESQNDLAIWYIHQDKSTPEILWLGTNKGLYFINRSKFPLTIHQAVFQKDGKFIEDANIFFIHQSKDILWLSTSDEGLLKYTISTGKLKKFTSQQGLPSDIMSGILADGSGRLWISSQNGIFVFDTKTEKVDRKYNTIDGLSTSRFNFRSCCKMPNGEMFFGSADGVNYFYPDSLKVNNYIPRLLITSFKTLYSERVQDLTSDSAVVLPYDQNSFAVEYASDDYTNPDKNTFSYQLAGFSSDWSKPDTRHYTAFTNLGPGSYVFKLRGANSDGLWGRKLIMLKIRILPPFWRTWWFYTFCILSCISAAGYVLYNFLQKKELRRKKVFAELAALRMQLNPHFVFNSLTTLEHFIAVNQNKLAIDYLVKFSRLMRMILENSAEEFISLKQEMEFLELYIFMESLRVSNKINFTISCDPDLDPDRIYIPPMLLQPLIENAIIHGVSSLAMDGKISISFISEDKGFIARVEDNGIGLDSANKNKTFFGTAKKSMGLKILKERLNIIMQMYGDYAGVHIADISEPGKTGTRIEIKMPFINETAANQKTNNAKVSYS